MLNRQDEQILTEELGQVLLTEPWRIQELIEKQGAYHRYRLFRAITWGRLFISLLLFFLFFFVEVSRPSIFVAGFYVISVIWALFSTKDAYDEVGLYSLFYALTGVLIFAYIINVTDNRYELGFIFFSVTISAMLLSFFHLFLITCMGALLLFVGWLEINFNNVSLLFSSSFWGERKSSQQFEEITILLIGLFLIAFTVHRLTKKALSNEIKAQVRHKQLRQILSFNRSIIENFKSGILIFSADAKMISINKKAVELLNIREGERITTLSELSPNLFQYYRRWSSSLSGSLNSDDSFTYLHNEAAEEVFVSFAEFAKTEQSSIIMMTLESVTKTLQQTQEAKLAALGQLTAGVAHEIRNPLASISSAAELLAESSDDMTHQKLSHMIGKNVQRTNRIINDILGLFKNKKGERKLLPVLKSLNDFCEAFILSNNETLFKIRIKKESNEELYFRFDSGQLEQVLWNLSANSIKYAQVDDLKITIQYNLSANRKNIYLYIYDNGGGIGKVKAKKIFEPFYAGSSDGSGLGLYLVRELCHANNANITYLLPIDRDDNLPKTGACFRISTPVYFTKNIKPKVD